MFRPLLSGICIMLLVACSGGGSTTIPNSTAITSIAADDVKPYTPGVDLKPEVAIAPHRSLTAVELAQEVASEKLLGDPQREATLIRRYTLNVSNVTESVVGTFTPYIPNEQGQIVNIGVQPTWRLVSNSSWPTGGTIFHTHSGLCFEYGINYSSDAAYLFGYNWCAGGNLPTGFMNIGLVGLPGGVLSQWSSNGNGWLLAWDSNMGTYKMALEEVLEKDGWHLLGYNWTTTKFIDIMNNFGVTGTINDWGGDDIFETHVPIGTSCSYNAPITVGTHLLYDMKKRVMLNGAWQTLDHVSGVYGETQIDCADISGRSHSGYTSPYYSGEYYQNPLATSSFGQIHAGDWWMTRR